MRYRAGDWIREDGSALNDWFLIQHKNKDAGRVNLSITWQPGAHDEERKE